MLFLPASLRFSVATGHFSAAAVRFDLIGEQGILLLAPIAYTSQLATPMPGCGLSVYDREHLRHGQDSPDPRWRQEAPLLSHRGDRPARQARWPCAGAPGVLQPDCHPHRETR